MRGLVLLLFLGLMVFILGIGAWGFLITSDLDGLTGGAMGAMIALGLGAVVMIGLFLLLMRRQHRSDRARGDW